ncbi:hypothetical protein [Micromonospora sp. NPDC047527]|uniref:hypothetical protein n=1 Tax=Micromonospora sp. NPDC047527 TaxID=3155144 RepID=UPI0034016187
MKEVIGDEMTSGLPVDSARAHGWLARLCAMPELRPYSRVLNPLVVSGNFLCVLVAVPLESRVRTAAAARRTRDRGAHGAPAGS